MSGSTSTTTASPSRTAVRVAPAIRTPSSSASSSSSSSSVDTSSTSVWPIVGVSALVLLAAGGSFALYRYMTRKSDDVDGDKKATTKKTKNVQFADTSPNDDVKARLQQSGGTSCLNTGANVDNALRNAQTGNLSEEKEEEPSSAASMLPKGLPKQKGGGGGIIKHHHMNGGRLIPDSNPEMLARLQHNATKSDQVLKMQNDHVVEKSPPLNTTAGQLNTKIIVNTGRPVTDYQTGRTIQPPSYDKVKQMMDEQHRGESVQARKYAEAHKHQQDVARAQRRNYEEEANRNTATVVS